jgi:DNA-directed RNA polymerase subunit M/transcription elongation factor TFIIS
MSDQEIIERARQWYEAQNLPSVCENCGQEGDRNMSKVGTINKFESSRETGARKSDEPPTRIVTFHCAKCGHQTAAYEETSRT